MMKRASVKQTTVAGSLGIRSQVHDLHLLVSQAAAGDHAAFAELYQQTCPRIFGLILRIVGNYSTAEEVLLDVYLQVWRQAANYDRGRGTPLGWLITIARSRAIDRLRADKKRPETELSSLEQFCSTSNCPEAASVASESQQLVRAAIATLTAEQRVIIDLAYYAGMSQSEISEKLGWPLGTVKTRARLALVKLREQLSGVDY